MFFFSLSLLHFQCVRYFFLRLSCNSFAEEKKLHQVLWLMRAHIFFVFLLIFQTKKKKFFSSVGSANIEFRYTVMLNCHCVEWACWFNTHLFACLQTHPFISFGLTFFIMRSCACLCRERCISIIITPLACAVILWNEKAGNPEKRKIIFDGFYQISHIFVMLISNIVLEFRVAKTPFHIWTFAFFPFLFLLSL